MANLLSKASNFLKAKLLTKYIVEAEEFHSYLLSIDADVCEIVAECIARGWISGPHFGGIDRDRLVRGEDCGIPDYYSLVESLRESKTPPTTTWDKATEARNKWIYEQCNKGVVYQTIVKQLVKKPKTWGRIDTDGGIKKAANAYAKAKGLPAIQCFGSA